MYLAEHELQPCSLSLQDLSMSYHLLVSACPLPHLPKKILSRGVGRTEVYADIHSDALACAYSITKS
jgi:hypothetical protein